MFGVRFAQSVYNSCWAVSELHCLPSAECLKLKACVCVCVSADAIAETFSSGVT